MKRNIFSKSFPKKSNSISHWFLSMFLIFASLFGLTLIPLFFYLQYTFSTLQQEKIQTQLNSGSVQLEAVVTGILNISSSLSADTRFIPLGYAEPAYDSIALSTRNQLKNTFNSFILPLELISDASLQLDLEQNIVITNKTVFFQSITQYYPDFFQVENLNSTEWTEVLSRNNTGFLPVQHITAYGKNYDALIFSTKWNKRSYLYACMDIVDIKKLLISEQDKSGYYITISNINGDLLYSDLPDNVPDFQTLSNRLTTGNLEISIHIDNSVFYQKFRPLYFFLIIYGSICIIVMLAAILTGAKVSAKPILNIIRLLEYSQNIPSTIRHSTNTRCQNGFDYISESILIADTNLGEYKNAFHTQQKILQALFLQKALDGQLNTPRSIHQFYSYFPNFPKGYYLLLLRLWTYEENSSDFYANPLQLLQSFLEKMLPNAYQQQLSDSELLLLVSEKDFENYCHTLDFMVENINREEPSYFVRCLCSNVHHHLESLPTAYHQLQDMIEFSFQGDQAHVCTISDLQAPLPPFFTMSDLLTLYTAITYGNHKIALGKLKLYSDKLNLEQNILYKRPLYEIIRSILLCIRLEHPLRLIYLHIPGYQPDVNLYTQLEEIVRIFCDAINNIGKTTLKPFVKELLQYIDANYRDSNLCLTSLETHFKCSSSTIRKAFKDATNITVTSYIEQKRMHLANELLAQNQMTIAEIAVECGFTSTNTFYKAYRRIYGHAPKMPKLS